MSWFGPVLLEDVLPEFKVQSKISLTDSWLQHSGNPESKSVKYGAESAAQFVAKVIGPLK